VFFIVLFVGMGWGIEGAILGSISGTLSGAIVALVIAGTAVLGRQTSPVRTLMQLALPAFFAMLFARLLDQVGILSLEAFGNDPAEVGYYGAAMNVLMVTSMIAAAVTPALVSTLTAARRRGDHDAVEQVSMASLRFGLVLMPFAAIVAGASTDIVPVLFGQAFVATAPLMALLMVGAVARANIVLIAAMLVSLDRAWLAAAIALPLPVIAVAAHSQLIPRHGALGAAWVSAVLALAGSALSVAVVCWVARLRVPVGTIVRTLAISFAAYVAATAWPAGPAMLFFKLAGLSLGVLAAYLGTGELSRDELRALRGALPGAGREA
jgi:O-antigen/teichoic acid export membrane protein